jgi:hypothetical protein
LLALAALLALSACARTELAHTPGEIPRDGHGRPIWSLIEPGIPAPTR